LYILFLKDSKEFIVLGGMEHGRKAAKIKTNECLGSKNFYKTIEKTKECCI